MSVCLACAKDAVTTYCPTCKIPVPNPKTQGEDSIEVSERFRRAEEFAHELMKDTQKAREFVDALGLGGFTIAELIAAISAIGQEKTHFYSGERDWMGGLRLLDLGLALSKQVGDKNARRLAAIRAAPPYIRAGMFGTVGSLLQEIDHDDLGEGLETYSDGEDVITIFSNLEIAAAESLAESMQGRTGNSEKVQVAVFHIWELMKPEIAKIIATGNKQSFLLGIMDNAFSVPRLDKLVFIESLLVQEAIASSELYFSDKVLERLKVLGRMVIILGEMTPDDDSGFYASALREYFWLFNGILAYDSALAENDLDEVQLTILQGHAIALQWVSLVQPESWLLLRPSIFVGIFFRAMRWSEQLDPQPFLDAWKSHATKSLLPYIDYTIGDALVNADEMERAIEVLMRVVQAEGAPESLVESAKYLIQRTILDSHGVTISVDFDVPEHILTVYIEVPEGLKKPVRFDLPTGMESMFLPPLENLLKLDFVDAKRFMGRPISVAGDVFENLVYRTPEHNFQRLNQTILAVGTSYYRDVHWGTPHNTLNSPVNGVRNDIVVIRLLRESRLHNFLFWNPDARVIKQEKFVVVDTPEHYHLAGIFTKSTPEEVLSDLMDMLAKDFQCKQLDIYTLKLDLIG